MKPDLPRLYLIRHGQTAWSHEGGPHTGKTDLPLTPHGEAMARRLKPYLAQVPFARVMTSPRQRARDTCALAGLAPQAMIVDDLSEWDYGDYEGRTSADIRQQAPNWSLFRDGCPGGETPQQIAQRADRLILGMGSLVGNIALFSHGQFLCALAARWIGLAVLEGQHFALDPASVSILGPKPGHGQMPVIERWNAGPDQDSHGR